MDKKFLIIGSNSFSGATFIKYLLERNYEVHGISRSNEINDLFLPYKWNNINKENFKFTKLDLNFESAKVIDLISDYKPEFIVNFAAQGMVAQSWETPEDWYQTNVVSQVKMHKQMIKMQFIKKYIHVTTPEVYGSTNDWITENDHFRPSTPYAVSRADMHLKSFFKAYKFPVLFTRSANVYGPGQQLYRIIPKAILCARLNQKLSLHGGGLSKRSFINMQDVCEATHKVIMSGNIGDTYHISTNDYISIKDLIHKICILTDTNFKDLVEVSGERLGKDDSYLLSSKKIRNDLSWKDNILIDEGLKETLRWVDNNLNDLKLLPADYIHKA